MKTRALETMPAEPPSAYGFVKVTMDKAVILEVVGKDRYRDLEAQASEAFFPECPELAIVYPVLSFNTSERAKLTFYESFDLPKLDENPSDLRNWGKKFPEDGGHMYQQAARLCKWS